MQDSDSVTVEYLERIKHVHSHFRTNDEELAFARTIEEVAETIQVTPFEEEHTEVAVYTAQGVYHFATFRTQYMGHASRTLIELLEHFHVRLPMEFVIDHQGFTIYLDGHKVVTKRSEYVIEPRDGFFELVEPVEWMISTGVLNLIEQMAEAYQISPVEVVENAVRLIAEPAIEEDDITFARESEE